MSHRLHSEETKQHVLDVYQRVGLNGAARETGIAKSTLLRWAKAAGVEPASVTSELTQRNRRAAASHAARADRAREELREEMIEQLGKTVRAASVRELQVLAAGGFGPDHLRTLTDSRTKATRDLELLEGRPTERVDHGAEVLQGVAVAMRRVLAEFVPEALYDVARLRLADELRSVQDEINRGAIEDAEYDELDAALPAGDVAA